MYKCQILFSSTTDCCFVFFSCPPPLHPPSCSCSLSLSTSHLLLAPPPHPLLPGGTAALHCWKSECVESLVELHCMYCIYGIKIVFCSSPASLVFPPPALPLPPPHPHGGQTRPNSTVEWKSWGGNKNDNNKKQKTVLFICKHKRR